MEKEITTSPVHVPTQDESYQGTEAHSCQGAPALRTGLLSSHQLLARGPGTPILAPTSRAWVLGQLRGKQDPHTPVPAWGQECLKICTSQIMECFQQVWGGKMGCEVPTCAGPSHCRRLCVSPSQSAPHVIFPGSPDPGHQGRGSLSIYLILSPTVRSLVPIICRFSPCCSFPDDVFRGLSVLSYHTLERPL